MQELVDTSINIENTTSISNERKFGCLVDYIRCLRDVSLCVKITPAKLFDLLHTSTDEYIKLSKNIRLYRVDNDEILLVKMKVIFYMSDDFGYTYSNIRTCVTSHLSNIPDKLSKIC